MRIFSRERERKKKSFFSFNTVVFTTLRKNNPQQRRLLYIENGLVVGAFPSPISPFVQRSLSMARKQEWGRVLPHAMLGMAFYLFALSSPYAWLGVSLPGSRRVASSIWRNKSHLTAGTCWLIFCIIIPKEKTSSDQTGIVVVDWSLPLWPSKGIFFFPFFNNDLFNLFFFAKKSKDEAVSDKKVFK